MIDLRKFKVKKNSLVTPFDYLLVSGNKVIQNANRLWNVPISVLTLRL